MRSIFLALLSILVLFSAVQGITIRVDGNFSDWRLNTSDFGENYNNWDPEVPGVFVWQEDWVGGGGYVGPGYGGQKYDVEAILATFDNDNLYVGIATGFPQQGYGYNYWHDAGDIFLDIDGNGYWDYAFIISNYIDGRETRDLVLGSLYEVSSVKKSLRKEADPWQLESGSLIGRGTLAYVDDPEHDFSRYFIEIGIPLDLLGNFSKVKIHWTMECGNDYGEVIAYTPEPASILLLGAGLFAVGLMVKRRKS